jgi:hypothetical protein
MEVHSSISVSTAGTGMDTGAASRGDNWTTQTKNKIFMIVIVLAAVRITKTTTKAVEAATATSICRPQRYLCTLGSAVATMTGWTSHAVCLAACIATTGIHCITKSLMIPIFTRVTVKDSMRVITNEKVTRATTTRLMRRYDL